MNFVFLSCNYPENYWMFCRGLKNHGARVLAIIDTPYENLSYELKENIDDHYFVSSFHHYDELIKACGYFTYKYGKIDWIESNNEAWLHTDAKLRDDFHVTTGFTLSEIEEFQSKSAMKHYYQNAKIPTARYCIPTNYEDCMNFADQVGYPMVLKPDQGVGACDTYKIENLYELQQYYENTKNRRMILEEYIEGTIFTFDGISDAHSNIQYLSSLEYVGNCMDSVLNHNSIGAYTSKHISDADRIIAQDVISAFHIQNRFFHCEFFRLNQDKEGLGKKGTIIGLEVNFRPPGVFLPDLMNYASNIDIYDIWAEILLKQQCSTKNQPRYSVAFCGRRKELDYQNSIEELETEFSDEFIYTKQLPEALAQAMGNTIMVCRFENEQRRDHFFKQSFALK